LDQLGSGDPSLWLSLLDADRSHQVSDKQVSQDLKCATAGLPRTFALLGCEPGERVSIGRCQCCTNKAVDRCGTRPITVRNSVSNRIKTLKHLAQLGPLSVIHSTEHCVDEQL